MQSRFFFVSVLSLILLAPSAVYAQSLDGMMGSTDSFNISVSPQYPVPGGRATLSFISSTLDLTNATMTVLVGGTQTYKGSIQPVSVPLGKNGTAVSVVVKITSAGVTYSQSVVIQPEDVSLIAEPLSSAPVLYQGKPLVPLGGNTRVVAIANFKDAAGKSLSPANLSYSWTVDDTQIANSSGIGKQTVIVASPLQYRDRTVSVSVRSQAGSLVGGASLSLKPAEPAVLIYENDPLLGIRFDHALSGTYPLHNSETILYASPFSLSLLTGAPLLQWFLNGSAAQKGSLITLRPTGSGQGSASLSLVASAGESTRATTNLSLSFGEKPSTNFFGL